MKPGRGYIGFMDIDVAMVRWPADDRRRRELARLGMPRLLLVDASAEPPVCLDHLEDWVRLPASTGDARARARALISRMHQAAATVPTVESGGTVRYGASRIELSPLQGRLVQSLIDRLGIVVSRDALMRSGWPDGGAGSNNLDVHMARIRKRIGPLGLEIRTIRSRGYLLSTEPEGGSDLRPRMPLAQSSGF